MRFRSAKVGLLIWKSWPFLEAQVSAWKMVRKTVCQYYHKSGGRALKVNLFMIENFRRLWQTMEVSFMLKMFMSTVHIPHSIRSLNSFDRFANWLFVWLIFWLIYRLNTDAKNKFTLWYINQTACMLFSWLLLWRAYLKLSCLKKYSINISKH